MRVINVFYTDNQYTVALPCANAHDDSDDDTSDNEAVCQLALIKEFVLALLALILTENTTH